MHPHRAFPPLLLLALLAACGGSSSTTPIGGADDGDGSGNGPPTVSIDGFDGNRFHLVGDRFTIGFTADDAGTAQVSVVMDADGSAQTTDDQIVVFGPVPDAGGAPVSQVVTIPPGTAPGRYTVLVIADDGSDVVVQSFATPVTVMPALAGIHPSSGSNHYAVVADEVYFSRNEAADGNQSLSNDGLADGDSVLARYDTVSVSLTQGGITIDTTPINGGESQILQNDASGTVGFRTLEIDEGADIDGDLNLLDQVASFWSHNDAAPVRNNMTGLIALLGFQDTLLHARYREALQGPLGTNRNQFGDADVADDVFAYVDTGVGAPSGAAQSVYFPMAAGPTLRRANLSIAAHHVTEAGQNNGDLTGDADALDTVLAIVGYGAGLGTPGQFLGFGGFDATNGIPVRAVDPAAAFDVSEAGGQLLAYYIDEAAAGGDQNADGNGAGFVPALYDVTGTEFVLPPPSAGQMTVPPAEPLMLLEGGLMFFVMSEALRAEGVLGTNNDGDAGADQRILCFADPSLGAAIATVPVNVAGGTNMGGLQALALDGGATARLAPGWLGVVVQEAANGNQDISGNGVVDTAFLLVDATTNPPTVHNPRLTTTGAGNIPATGLGSTDGVLVRIQESLNGGDRDGDGKGAETLFTYISFAGPTNLRFLDGGGDYAAIAGDRIGVTANESLTQDDYDRNGSQSDFVFRVFSTGGGVLHEGTLSHAMSVPASHLGTLWAFLRNEAAEARDLNGDSDTADVILGLWSAP